MRTPPALHRLVLLLALALAPQWPALAQEAAPAGVSEGVSAHFFGSLTGSASTAPGPADALFASLASTATSTIDIALYDLNRATVRDALLAAKARGVAVRVAGDDDVAAKQEDGAFYQALQVAGIPLVTDAPRNSLQHNKFAVFDRRTVWTGSTNFSDNAFSRNGENTLVMTDTQVAQIYTTEFEEMAGGAFSNDKTDNTAHQADVGGTAVEVAFSPTDGVEGRIITALASAEHSIQVAMFVLTNDRIGAELMAARERGVAVEVLLDQVQAGSVFGLRDALCAADVTVRVEDWTGLLHNKYAVVDAGTASDPLVITGSTNWTASAVAENDENLVVVHSAAVAQAYAGDIARLKAPIGPDAFACNTAEPGEIPTPRVYLPVIGRGAADEPPPPVIPPDQQVTIATVVYDPPGDDLAGEHVLLRNSGGRPVDLGGWTLRDEAGAIYTFPAVTLGAGAELRVWVKAGTDDAANLYWGRGQPVWNNSGDTATLRDVTGQEWAVYSYVG
jgi:phosphatidylserine/phosphatidylglycerophosphate/cardiolipin synthase-like enzyme